MFLQIRRGIKRINRKFRKDDSGVTAIEFAMLGGPFLFLMFATFETGFSYMSEYSLQSATVKASRLIRTGQVQQGGMSPGEFKDELCSHMPGYMNCAGSVIVNVETRNTFAATNTRTTGGDGEGGMDQNLQDNPAWQPGAPGAVVIVETFYEQQIYVPFLNELLTLNGTPQPPHFLANHGKDKRLLRGVAVFMNEPFNPVN